MTLLKARKNAEERNENSMEYRFRRQDAIKVL